MTRVNSTPIVVRSLRGVFPQRFRHLTPVDSGIGDYATFAVGKDSEIEEFLGPIERYRNDPTFRATGSDPVQGCIKHLVAALAMKSAGADPDQVRWIPYHTGGPAMAALLTGEIQTLSTGPGEAIQLARQGEVDVRCGTASKRVGAAPDVRRRSGIRQMARFLCRPRHLR